MSKIEEVARAIYEAYDNRPPYAQLQMNGHLALDLALAAIRALREPDEGMIGAGDRAIFHADPDWQSNACWRAMIDSILSEEGEKP